jgi:hypothetical protein
VVTRWTTTVLSRQDDRQDGCRDLKMRLVSRGSVRRIEIAKRSLSMRIDQAAGSVFGITQK